MWVSKRFWKEMEEISRMEELTKKMKKMVNDYADLTIKDIENALEHRSSTDSERIRTEAKESMCLYNQLILRMQPLNVYLSKRENMIFAGIQITAASISVLSLFIMWLLLR